MVTPRLVRGIVLVWCAGGIVGMVVTSANDNIDGAITFGLLTAVGALALILVTAVAGKDAFGRAGEPDPDRAEHVERQIAALVRDGVDEGRLRRLVRDVYTLGRDVRSDVTSSTPTDDGPPVR